MLVCFPPHNHQTPDGYPASSHKFCFMTPFKYVTPYVRCLPDQPDPTSVSVPQTHQRIFRSTHYHQFLRQVRHLDPYKFHLHKINLPSTHIDPGGQLQVRLVLGPLHKIHTLSHDHCYNSHHPQTFCEYLAFDIDLLRARSILVFDLALFLFVRRIELILVR
jgi:hypothetical protein